jgi:hypothetical protein
MENLADRPMEGWQECLRNDMTTGGRALKPEWLGRTVWNPCDVDACEEASRNERELQMPLDRIIRFCINKAAFINET